METDSRFLFWKTVSTQQHSMQHHKLGMGSSFLKVPWRDLSVVAEEGVPCLRMGKAKCTSRTLSNMLAAITHLSWPRFSSQESIWGTAERTPCRTWAPFLNGTKHMPGNPTPQAYLPLSLFLLISRETHTVHIVSSIPITRHLTDYQ